MNCPSCGEAMPDNRDYCQYCGWQAPPEHTSDENETQLTKEPAENNKIQNNQFTMSDSLDGPALQEGHPMSLDSSSNPSNPIKRNFCKYCGGAIDQSTRKCMGCGKQFFVFPVKNALIAIFAIIIIASLIIIFVQRANFSETESSLRNEMSKKDVSISNLESQNRTKDSTIDSLNSQISSLTNQVSNYKKDSETLSSILSFLQNKNTGAASNKFKASDKIFIVTRSDTQTSFILTCDFPGSTSIHTSRSGSSADIIFSQDRWYGPTTKMFIKPNSIGTTVVTFSNDQNTQTFKIMIIVTN